jgi:hypothetical protein
MASPPTVQWESYLWSCRSWSASSCCQVCRCRRAASACSRATPCTPADRRVTYSNMVIYQSKHRGNCWISSPFPVPVLSRDNLFQSSRVKTRSVLSRENLFSALPWHPVPVLSRDNLFQSSPVTTCSSPLPWQPVPVLSRDKLEVSVKTYFSFLP